MCNNPSSPNTGPADRCDSDSPVQPCGDSEPPESNPPIALVDVPPKLWMQS